MKNDSLTMSSKTNDAFVMDIESAKEQSSVVAATITSVQQDNFITENNGDAARKKVASIELDNVSEDYDISYNFNQYSAIRWIVQSQFVQALERLYPLVITLCYGLDIALDIHQTNTYYRIFQNGTQLSHERDHISIEDKNLTVSDTSSSRYLFASISAWVSVPLLWSLILLMFTQTPFPVMSRIMKHYFNYEYNFSQGTCLKILLGLLALPIDSIISILW